MQLFPRILFGTRRSLIRRRLKYNFVLYHLLKKREKWYDFVIKTNIFFFSILDGRSKFTKPIAAWRSSFLILLLLVTSLTDVLLCAHCLSASLKWWPECWSIFWKCQTKTKSKRTFEIWRVKITPKQSTKRLVHVELSLWKVEDFQPDLTVNDS